LDGAGVRKLLGLGVVFLSIAARAASVEVALVSNFSRISENTLNPYVNSFENGVRLALADQAAALKSKKLQVEIKKFNISDDVAGIRESARLVSMSHAIAAIGYHSSTAALLAGPIYEENKLLMISPSASANRVYEIGPHVLSMVYSNRAQASALARYATDKLKARKIQIIEVSGCAYCADLAESFSQALAKEKGLRISTEKISEDNKTLSAVAAKILSQKTDLVFLPNYEFFSARVIQQLVSAGFKGAFLGGDGMYNANGAHLFKLANAKDVKLYFLGHWNPAADSEATRRFIAAYKAKFAKAPDTDTVLGYDSMNLLLKALLSAPAADRKSAQGAIAKLETFPGLSGEIRFANGSNGTFSKTAPLFSFNLAHNAFDVVDVLRVSNEKH